MPAAASITGASTCCDAFARQYADDSPSHTLPGSMTDASSSHDPKYTLRLAELDGAEVAVTDVAGEDVAFVAAPPPCEPLFLFFPGADALLPCAATDAVAIADATATARTL